VQMYTKNPYIKALLLFIQVLQLFIIVLLLLFKVLLSLQYLLTYSNAKNIAYTETVATY
jgi:hypothetical protein